MDPPRQPYRPRLPLLLTEETLLEMANASRPPAPPQRQQPPAGPQLQPAAATEVRRSITCTKCGGKHHYSTTCSLTIRGNSDRTVLECQDLARALKRCAKDEESRLELQSAIRRVLDLHAHSAFHLDCDFCPRRQYQQRFDTGSPRTTGEKRERIGDIYPQ